MRYGDLTVFAGPMFADKTNSLVKEILFRTYFGDQAQTAVFKPGFDERYASESIVSHDGLTVTARIARNAKDISSFGLRWAFFDEVQFFAEPYFEGDLITAVRDLRSAGVDVVCAGLDMDYLGRAFEVTAFLMAEASRVEKLRALCSVCGAPATHTARCKTEHHRRFELGSNETYSPMCASHWSRDLGMRVSEVIK